MHLFMSLGFVEFWYIQSLSGILDCAPAKAKKYPIRNASGFIFEFHTRKILRP
jgi:hypothetical protein